LGVARFVNLSRDVVDLFVPDPALAGAKVLTLRSEDALRRLLGTGENPGGRAPPPRLCGGLLLS
jgi:hypothetical protein